MDGDHLQSQMLYAESLLLPLRSYSAASQAWLLFTRYLFLSLLKYTDLLSNILKNTVFESLAWKEDLLAKFNPLSSKSILQLPGHHSAFVSWQSMGTIWYSTKLQCGTNVKA